MAVGGESPWTRDQYLAADIFHALAGQVHPSRPQKGTSAPKGATRHASLASRLKAQRERLNT